MLALSILNPNRFILMPLLFIVLYGRKKMHFVYSSTTLVYLFVNHCMWVNLPHIGFISIRRLPFLKD